MYQKQLVFKGVPMENRIIPLIRYSRMLSDNSYYTVAIELWELNYESYSETYRNMILREFVTSILNEMKPNPINWIQILNKPTGLSEEKFIALLFEVSDIKKAFSLKTGTGTLPDVWDFIESDELKHEILDIISTNIEKQEKLGKEAKMLASKAEKLVNEAETLTKEAEKLVNEAEKRTEIAEKHSVIVEKHTEVAEKHAAVVAKQVTAAEKKLFLEDLYLIDNDIIEISSENNKWHKIVDWLDTFEPETPPKSMLEEVKMNTQNQSEMQQLINN
jgi:hypothetical protein